MGAAREAPLGAIFAFFFFFLDLLFPRRSGRAQRDAEPVASGLQRAPSGAQRLFLGSQSLLEEGLVFPSPTTFPAHPAPPAGAGVHNPVILTSSLRRGRYAFRHVPISKSEENRHFLILFLHFSPLLFPPFYQPTWIWKFGGKMLDREEKAEGGFFFTCYFYSVAVGAPHELNCGIESPADFPGLKYRNSILLLANTFY